MNKLKIIPIALVMMLSIAGCSIEEEIQDVLDNKPSAITSKTINLTMMQPETINPITNKNKSVSYIMNLIYDGLFTIDENYNTVPQLVDQYKTMGFHLQRLYKRREVNEEGEVLSTMSKIMGGN